MPETAVGPLALWQRDGSRTQAHGTGGSGPGWSGTAPMAAAPHDHRDREPADALHLLNRRWPVQLRSAADLPLRTPSAATRSGLAMNVASRRSDHEWQRERDAAAQVAVDRGLREGLDCCTGRTVRFPARPSGTKDALRMPSGAHVSGTYAEGRQHHCQADSSAWPFRGTECMEGAAFAFVPVTGLMLTSG